MQSIVEEHCRINQKRIWELDLSSPVQTLEIPATVVYYNKTWILNLFSSLPLFLSPSLPLPLPWPFPYFTWVHSFECGSQTRVKPPLIAQLGTSCTTLCGSSEPIAPCDRFDNLPATLDPFQLLTLCMHCFRVLAIGGRQAPHHPRLGFLKPCLCLSKPSVCKFLCS